MQNKRNQAVIPFFPLQYNMKWNDETEGAEAFDNYSHICFESSHYYEYNDEQGYLMHFCTTLKCHYFCCQGDWTFFKLGKNAYCLKSLIKIGEYLFLNHI